MLFRSLGDYNDLLGDPGLLTETAPVVGRPSTPVVGVESYMNAHYMAQQRGIESAHSHASHQHRGEGVMLATERKICC